MRAFEILVVAAGALLCGCVIYHPKPLDPAAAARAIENRSLEDPGLVAFIRAAQPAAAAAAPRWDLTRLTLAAVYFHPNLDIARSKIHQAAGAEVTARQIPNPTLSFEDLSVGPALSGPAYTMGPVINFIIETGGRRTYRTAGERALVRAAYADLSTAFWRVRGDLRDALLAAQSAKEGSALLEQRLAVQDEIVTAMTHRLAQGEASSLELAREELNRDQLRQSFADAQREAAASPGEIAMALGVTPDAVRTVMGEFEFFRNEAPALDRTLAQLQTSALLERTDLQALLQQYAAAESALALEVARQYPNITLGPGYSFDSTQNRYLLMPEVEIPLFNHNAGSIHEAAAKREEVAARVTALQLRIISSVDEGLASYGAALKSANASASAVGDEEAQARRMERSLEEGAIDRPTFLGARIEVLSARQAALEATIQVYRALGTVEDAVQVPILDAISSAPLDTNPRYSRAEPSGE